MKCNKQRAPSAEERLFFLPLQPKLQQHHFSAHYELGSECESVELRNVLEQLSLQPAIERGSGRRVVDRSTTGELQRKGVGLPLLASGCGESTRVSSSG